MGHKTSESVEGVNKAILEFPELEPDPSFREFHLREQIKYFKLKEEFLKYMEGNFENDRSLTLSFEEVKSEIKQVDNKRGVGFYGDLSFKVTKRYKDFQ